jgi:hypothetical protein
MNGFNSTQLTLTIPPQFTPLLDELVAQTGAGSREAWLKNVVKNILVDYQVRKHYGPQYQQQMMQVANLWP